MKHTRELSRRTFLLSVLSGGAITLTGCTGGRDFSLWGYSTQPNYNPDIRSVYVRLFKSRIFETTPFREMEITQTRYVVDAIESRTPMKVISDPSRADSELQGSVVNVGKNLLNRTPFNGAREIELALTVEIVWHDLRPGHEGEVLSNSRRPQPRVPAPEGLLDPSQPPNRPAPESPTPVLLLAAGRALPELGETVTTALDMAMKEMAIRIVQAMETNFG